MSDPATAWRERLRAAIDGVGRVPTVSTIPPDLLQDLAEERAAILEYSAGVPRFEADRRAFEPLGLVPPGADQGKS